MNYFFLFSFKINRESKKKYFLNKIFKISCDLKLIVPKILLFYIKDTLN